LSETALALLLDRLNDAGKAFVQESEHVVTASNLSFGDARELLTLCVQLHWPASAYDQENSEWTMESISADFAPFRVSLRKPEAPPDVLQLLTLTGYRTWLVQGHVATRWHVAGLSEPFRTKGRIYEPWRSRNAFESARASKNPRSLVREHAAQRVVCADIRVWLLAVCDEKPDGPVFRIWAEAAIAALLYALADEIDSEDFRLKFKGPPRLAIPLSASGVSLVEALGEKALLDLQTAASWVFENEREAEMRHILLATEMARSGGREADAISYVKVHLAVALEGAKIAYQMAIAEVSRETLKVLADLRKAITEETSKVTDATRQVIASLASSLAVGLGLIAARLATNASPALIVAVMLVIAFYVVATILSGRQFIHLQRGLRQDWKPRLYRFIPDDEYQRMVSAPTARAESAFRMVALIGGSAIALLTVAVIYTASYGVPPSNVVIPARPGAVSPGAKVTAPKVRPTSLQSEQTESKSNAASP